MFIELFQLDGRSEVHHLEAGQAERHLVELREVPHRPSGIADSSLLQGLSGNTSHNDDHLILQHPRYKLSVIHCPPLNKIIYFWAKMKVIAITES